MLIRWQTYRSKGGLYRGKTTRVRAILSVSVRVNGQSRQKFIAVIGSFVAERLDVEARRNFWNAAHEQLSAYVPDDDRSRIEAALARRVPPPILGTPQFNHSTQAQLVRVKPASRQVAADNSPS